MRLALLRAEKSGFPPGFPLNSDTVISPLFRAIPGYFCVDVGTKLAPNCSVPMEYRRGYHPNKKARRWAALHCVDTYETLLARWDHAAAAVAEHFRARNQMIAEDSGGVRYL
jgi:hypothetical protein